MSSDIVSLPRMHDKNVLVRSHTPWMSCASNFSTF